MTRRNNTPKLQVTSNIKCRTTLLWISMFLASEDTSNTCDSLSWSAHLRGFSGSKSAANSANLDEMCSESFRDLPATWSQPNSIPNFKKFHEIKYSSFITHHPTQNKCKILWTTRRFQFANNRRFQDSNLARGFVLTELTEDIASGRVFLRIASTAEERIWSLPMKLINTDSGTLLPGRKPGICAPFSHLIAFQIAIAFHSLATKHYWSQTKIGMTASNTPGVK